MVDGKSWLWSNLNYAEAPPPGLPSGPDTQNYLAHDDDRSRVHVVKDTKPIGSAYDRYLQSTVGSCTKPRARSRFPPL